jgi:predicted ATPase
MAGGPDPTLVGRDDECEQLYRLVDRIGTRGGALAVRGEAGIGKSALLRAVAARARTHGATVATATGTQSETRLAFGGLHQVLLPFLHAKDELPDLQRQALDVAFGLVEARHRISS